ncbi:signal peptidase I [Rathayibacter tritici]|uniref:Signal peptidase I n=1 Tax=Rathayibacter tritici TaxID=33888 RepID=A0A160KSE3_9MICO|nr:signal peptidase I [Rathayibacter tritici]AND16626.1 signal peptidase I [Rathayibacter tritici]PPF28318.1 signal peptidase I [Rathayibacter tritici]PPF65987.1 signal peptidase I [Rathayibacter tritici]PPG09431.1 signal peptidase I [Rathayibacter tritici]PPI13271.1 signal peptidase I [Rathayibacter tritici]
MTDSTAPVRLPGDDDEHARHSADPSENRPRKRRGVLLFLRDVLIIVVVAVLVSFLVKTFLVRSFYIPSSSMEQTLVENDRILVNELVPGVVPISRGDVVVFRDPGGWLSPSSEASLPPLQAAVDSALALVGLTAPDSNDHLIKRVIGLPGDHVTCCTPLGQVEINGNPITEPYVKLPEGVQAVSATPFDVVVPAGSLWVMGDNRYNSADSRYNTDKPGGGFVPIDHVVGRAVLVTWPVQHWAWLDDYPSVFRGVETDASEENSDDTQSGQG